MRLLRILAGCALAGAVLVVAEGGYAAWSKRRVVTLPAPTGPFAVGRQQFSWRDTTRADLLAPDPRAPRELLVWVWYPAARTPATRVAEYLPPAWVKAVSRIPRGHRLDRVRAHALDAPSVSDAQQVYPLLIFSPGLGNVPTNYTTLLEDIASHGYIVVAVAHPYSTPEVVFPDGRVVREAESGLHFRFDRTVVVLASDLVAVLSHVKQEHDRGDPVFMHADPGRAGVFGHSFGGAAAAQALSMDARFVAGADVDGTVFGPVMRTGVRQPFLLMMANLDWTQRLRRTPKLTIVPRERARVREETFISHAEAASWVNVAHLTHMNVADEAYFYAAHHRLLELVGARLDGHETQSIVSDLLRGFFGRYLRGETRDPLLEHRGDKRLSWMVQRAP